MFSDEFMRYLINYQKPQVSPEKQEKKTRLAKKARGNFVAVLLTVKK